MTYLKPAVMLAIGICGAVCLAGPVPGELVVTEAPSQTMENMADLTESALEPAVLTGSAITGQDKANRTSDPASMRPRPAETTRSSLSQLTPPPGTPGTRPPADPSLGAEIRSTVKESIRPLHDQLVESGAADAWKELKTDLGLGKSAWGDEGANPGNPKMSGQLDGPNAARWQEPEHRPKTAAQAQMDRELASHMLEKLIDEVKPWAFSLLGLYLLGYLIKTGIDYSQRMSIRRRERETRRILRKASSKAASTKPEA